MPCPCGSSFTYAKGIGQSRISRTTVRRRAEQREGGALKAWQSLCLSIYVADSAVVRLG